MSDLHITDPELTQARAFQKNMRDALVSGVNVSGGTASELIAALSVPGLDWATVYPDPGVGGTAADSHPINQGMRRMAYAMARAIGGISAPTWYGLGYINGFENAGLYLGGLTGGPGQFCQTLDGWVHLRGIVSNPTPGVLTVPIAGLPVGMRPSVVRLFSTSAGSIPSPSLFATIYIDSAGTIRLEYADASDPETGIVLDGIRFYPG
jgi:hypothetical protein